jgi:maleate cis-trans isomerase
MTHHFGVLIPSTNTTVETECRLLPMEYQAHIGRLLTSTPGQTTFTPSRDEDVDYQSRLLGTANVEVILLCQTSASVHDDRYDDDVTRRMSEGAGGVPAVTSAQSIGRGLQALGVKRIGLISPYSEKVIHLAADYLARKFGIETVALEAFGATDSHLIASLNPQTARDAMVSMDRPEIEAFVVAGGNFPTIASIEGWETEFKKPVLSTNQAFIWAMVTMLTPGVQIRGFGRLLMHTEARS